MPRVPMDVHAGLWTTQAERAENRRVRAAVVVALALHLAVISMSGTREAPRLALIHPLKAAEIAVQVDEPAPGAPGGGASLPETPRAEPEEEPQPPPPPRASRRPAQARARISPRPVAPPTIEAGAAAQPSWSPPPGVVPIPSNSRANQSAAPGAGAGRGSGAGGLFGNGRFVGGGPGALEARVCFIPETTRSVEELGACEAVHKEFLDVIDVPSRRFEDGFPGFAERTEWFSVTIGGSFTVQEPGLYRFRLKSDDGSQLFIDNQLVIDNDGIHEAISKRGQIELEAGRHQILVKYFQGMKFVLALQLFVTPPGQPERLFSTAL